jgi:SET domain-containing protein
MMTVRCYLAPSDIEGLGVFCRDDIRKGDVIWTHDPVLDLRIPVSKVALYPPHVQEFIDRYGYLDVLDPTMVVLESDEGRFMNHSAAPNCDFNGIRDGFALVDIPAGTELTCDYGEFVKEELVMQPPRHRVHGEAARAS